MRTEEQGPTRDLMRLTRGLLRSRSISRRISTRTCERGHGVLGATIRLTSDGQPSPAQRTTKGR